MVLWTGYNVRRDILWTTPAYIRQFVAQTVILIANEVILIKSIN
jgi:hypothetical protein